MDAMEISRTGLDVEWRRLEIIAQNLANAGTSRTASGEAYRPLRLVSGPSAGFASHLGSQPGGAAAGLRGGVSVYGIEPTNVAPRMVHQPGHPHADEDGFVAFPGLDHAGEMTLMVQTARIYEANLVAMNIARQMYAKAIELGRRG